MVAITESQEDAIAAARARSRQDKVHPFLIHLEDGRLIPNTPLIRKNPKYRVYLGDINATLSERMRFINSGVGRTKVVDSSEPEPDVFDIGKATKDELVVFAMGTYGVSLAADTDIRTLRKQVSDLHKQRSERLD